MIVNLDCSPALFAYPKLSIKMLYLKREFTVGLPGLAVVVVYRPIANRNERKTKAVEYS